jgi:hypothetical protein
MLFASIFWKACVGGALPGLASIDVILAFLLTGVLLGVLQLWEQIQIELDVWL